MRTRIKSIVDSSGNIAMYVGLIFVAYSMFKNNDFSSEPAVTAIIILSLIMFSLLRYIHYKILVREIRKNESPFISYEIDKGF